MEQEIKKVEEWLDTVIGHATILRDMSRKPFKYGSGEVELITCFSAGSASIFAIHIYDGLQRIAKLLGLDVEVNHIVYDDGDENDEFSVMYKGCQLYQLGADKEVVHE